MNVFWGKDTNLVLLVVFTLCGLIGCQQSDDGSLMKLIQDQQVEIIELKSQYLDSMKARGSLEVAMEDLLSSTQTLSKQMSELSKGNESLKTVIEDLKQQDKPQGEKLRLLEEITQNLESRIDNVAEGDIKSMKQLITDQEKAIDLLKEELEDLGEVPKEPQFKKATFAIATPPSGSEVSANATIALVFDQVVKSVPGATGSGRFWTIPVAANLSVIWVNVDDSLGGPQAFSYKLKASDKTAPKISGGNVKNGAKDVDPAPLNEKGITLAFSEAVGQGTAELKPEGGEVLGTEAKWEGKKVTLTLLAGKTLANETTYVITIGGVKDAAGNALQGGTVKFTTKGKE